MNIAMTPTGSASTAADGPSGRRPVEPCDIIALAETIRRTAAPVVLFGAGSYGRLAHYAMTQRGIPVRYFCDSDSKKHGTTYCGVEVISPATLATLSPDTRIFISSNFLIPIIAQIDRSKFAHLYTCVALFDAADFSQSDKAEVGMDRAEVARRILTHRNASTILEPESDHDLNIRMIDVVVTEKCTMKCKDCSNLMQYYEAPKDSDVDILLRAFDKIAHCTDRFHEIRVLGGEPFVNKQIHAVINKLVSYPHVEKVAIFTNATIVPKGENLTCLQHEKVFLDITHYGDLSRNHDKLVAAMEEHGIAYITHAPQIWTDSAKLDYHERPPSDLADMFSKCCVNDILTLLNGKLYRCPFSANAMNLKAIPNIAEDYIDLDDPSKDMAAIKSELRNLYTKRSYISACLYCNGRDYATPQVEAGLQTKTILPLPQRFD